MSLPCEPLTGEFAAESGNGKEEDFLAAVPILPGHETRVLILAPLQRDAKLTAEFLATAGMEAAPCDTPEQVCAHADAGCGAIVIAEEALNNHSMPLFQALLRSQPSWSDIPIILITSGGEASTEYRFRLAGFGPDGNVTLIERPFRPGTLVSSLRVALRSRRRQYQVRDLLEQSRQSEQRLREADRRKDEFLAMLAHELRNPLSSISNAVALLQQNHSRTPDSDAKSRDLNSWAAAVIERQNLQLARLVDDLLDVSRITRGKIELRKEHIDAATCLESAKETIAPLIAKRHHTLVSSIPVNTLWLEADPARLEQIVVNLLANAARYTEPHGFIRLEARREEEGSGGRGKIVIEVSDSGIGIAPERIPSMFELFVQGNRSIARSEGGLGIGLTVVRRLCEMHGGSVTAHSDGPGKGSRFAVRLPAAPIQPRMASHRNRSSEGEGRGIEILIVDDNVDTANGLACLLTRRGYIAEVVHDGFAALEAARKSPPAVVFLDIGLPGIDGYEVARRLRAHHGADSMRIIALSGYGQEEDRRLANEAGFDHHLVKPVKFDQILALLGAHSSQH